jgi:hypothetical protein
VIKMRISISTTVLTMLMLAGCQSAGDNADAVPASAVPPAMAATVTAADGAPADIADLVNARAASAKSQMQARGYAVTGYQGGAAFWWNPTTTICARVVTSNGRYQTIGTASTRYCGY